MFAGAVDNGCISGLLMGTAVDKMDRGTPQLKPTCRTASGFHPAPVQTNQLPACPERGRATVHEDVRGEEERRNPPHGPAMMVTIPTTKSPEVFRSLLEDQGWEAGSPSALSRVATSPCFWNTPALGLSRARGVPTTQLPLATWSTGACSLVCCGFSLRRAHRRRHGRMRLRFTAEGLVRVNAAGAWDAYYYIVHETFWNRISLTVLSPKSRVGISANQMIGSIRKNQVLWFPPDLGCDRSPVI